MEHKNEFDAAVTCSQLHPTNKQLALACPMGEDPVLIDYLDEQEEGAVRRLPLASSLAAEAKKAGDEPSSSPSAATGGGAKKSGVRGKVDANTTACFNKDGSRVYVGDSSGNIVIFEPDTVTAAAVVAAAATDEGKVGAAAAVQTQRVPGGAGIRSIQFSRSGDNFVINSNDRVIRLFDTASCVCMQEFRDVVNQLRWRKCSFSCDGDYIIAGSAEEAKHNMYIWNPLDGQLLKILEGPKEGLLDLVWHPLRPLIASGERNGPPCPTDNKTLRPTDKNAARVRSVSTGGQIFIWSTHHTESWSAFAPDFKELEENEEYSERYAGPNSSCTPPHS
jgi:COMPASS component SWD1